MWNESDVVPLGTSFNEKPGDGPLPHHRKLIEKADALTVLATSRPIAHKLN
jgi:hypothetical protein